MSNPFDNKMNEIIHPNKKNWYYMLSFMAVFGSKEGIVNIKYFNIVLVLDKQNIPLKKMEYCNNRVAEQLLEMGVPSDQIRDIVCISINILGNMKHSEFMEDMNTDEVPNKNILN